MASLSAGVAQLVERHLPKVNVVSSSLITRYTLRGQVHVLGLSKSRKAVNLAARRIRPVFCGCSSVVEHHVANVRVVSSSLITRYTPRCQVLRFRA